MFSDDGISMTSTAQYHKILYEYVSHELITETYQTGNMTKVTTIVSDILTNNNNNDRFAEHSHSYHLIMRNCSRRTIR